MAFDQAKKTLIFCDYIFNLNDQKKITMNKNDYEKVAMVFFGSKRTRSDYEQSLIILGILEYSTTGFIFNREDYLKFKKLQETKEKLYEELK